MTTIQAFALLCAGLSLASYQRQSLALMFALIAAMLSAVSLRRRVLPSRRGGPVAGARASFPVGGTPATRPRSSVADLSRLEPRRVAQDLARQIGDPGR